MMDEYNNRRPKKVRPPEEPIVVDPELLAQHLECKKAQDKKIREFRENLKEAKEQRKEEVDGAVREAAKISYEASLLRDTPREEWEHCIEVVLKIEVENVMYRGKIDMIKEDLEEWKAAAALEPMEASEQDSADSISDSTLSSAELNRKLYSDWPIYT